MSKLTMKLEKPLPPHWSVGDTLAVRTGEVERHFGVGWISKTGGECGWSS